MKTGHDLVADLPDRAVIEGEEPRLHLVRHGGAGVLAGLTSRPTYFSSSFWGSSRSYS